MGTIGRMVKSRYQATGVEVEFEPGSRGRVLRNLLGITRVRDMNLAESQALEIAQDLALDRGALKKHTPCRPADDVALALALAEVDAAMGRDYRPLAALFEKIIVRSKQRVAANMP